MRVLMSVLLLPLPLARGTVEKKTDVVGVGYYRPVLAHRSCCRPILASFQRSSSSPWILPHLLPSVKTEDDPHRLGSQKVPEARAAEAGDMPGCQPLHVPLEYGGRERQEVQQEVSVLQEKAVVRHETVDAFLRQSPVKGLRKERP
jgi:hypothetical protein